MSTRTLFSTVTLGCWLFSSLAIGQTQPRPRITKDIDDFNTVVMSGNVHPAAAAATSSQPADDNMPMQRMIVYLKGSSDQEAQLEQLVAGQNNPQSPYYHKYLSPQQFATQFGAAQSDVESISSWLQAHGFTIDEIPAGNRSIVFSGTAGQVANAFGTEIRRYNVAGKTHYANASDPQIPAALADVVGGIVKLHDFRHGHDITPAKLLGSDYSQPKFTYGSSHYVSPADYGIIYDINPLYTAGVTGSGQTIAVLARSDIYMSDVESFRSNMGLKANNPVFVVTNSDPGVVSGDTVETTLDTEWAGAVAPSATIKVIISASTSSADGIDLSALYAVNNNVAPIITLSYGSCEAGMGSSELSFYNSLWKQAASQGQTVLVAAGDSGAAGCDYSSPATHGLGINGLCSSPYSTCVGGTEFVEGNNPGQYWQAGNNTVNGSAISYIPETIWNESGNVSGGSGLWAGGGGSSIAYSKPSWQTGTGVPSDGARDVPDVSLTAAGHDGYLIWLDGQLNAVGGTSAATPSFAGMIALLNQKINSKQGLINTTLYPLAAKQSSLGVTIFHDTTTGNNSVPGQTGFSATTGYDRASGLGSVDANLFVNNWASGAAPAASLTLSASSTSVTLLAGKTGSTTVTSTATSLNSVVTLTVSGAPTGLTATFASATVALPGSGTDVLNLSAASTIAPGTYSLTVKGVGGTQTATLTISVLIPAPTFTLTPASSTLTAAAGGSTQVTVSDAPQNGFISSIALSATGLPTGITAAFTPSTLTTTATSSTAVFTVAKTVAGGTYSFKISATGGGVTQTIPVTLTATVPASCTLTANPTSLTVVEGQTATSQVSCGSVQGTFSAPLTLSLANAPTGITAKVSSSTMSAGSSTTLSVTAASTLAAGSYSISLTASGSGFTQTLAVPVTVPTPTFTLTPSATTAQVMIGSSVKLGVSTTPANGFSAAVTFTASGLPTGVTAAFTTATGTTASGAGSTLTLTAGSAAKAGTTNITITGTGGGVTKSVTVALTVTAQPICNFGTSPTLLSLTAGQSSSASLTCTVTQGSFTTPLAVSVSGAPTGMTLQAPTSLTPGSTASLGLTTALSTAAGTYKLALSVSGSGYTQSITLPVTVSAANTFTLAANSTSISAALGATASVNLTTQAYGIFNSAVGLKVSGLPTGVTATASTSTIAAPGSGTTTISFAIGSSASTGTHPITITATGGTATQSVTVNLVLSAPPSFTLSLGASSLTLTQGTSGVIVVSTGNYANGFNGQMLLTFSGLPAGVNYAMTGATSTATMLNLNVTLTVPASTPAGTYVITVTDTGNSGSAATGNGVTHSATFNLIVTASTAQAKK